MRAFFLDRREIVQTLPAPLGRASPSVDQPLTLGATTLPLPWSHHVRLLAVKNPNARRFNEAELVEAVEKTQRALTSAMRKRR